MDCLDDGAVLVFGRRADQLLFALSMVAPQNEHNVVTSTSTHLSNDFVGERVPPKLGVTRRRSGAHRQKRG